jgi:fibronectin type 3 domain-containing protein
MLGVTLTNSGNSNVTISKVGVSGAGYSANGISAGLILAPWQSATLDETFLPVASGSFSGTVTVTSNATNSPATISASGSGSATAASHAIDLAWTASTSTVEGYDVFRSEVSGGPYAKLDSSVVTATSFIDTTVQAGKTYYYVVAAVSPAGVESADSAQASATVPTP